MAIFNKFRRSLKLDRNNKDAALDAHLAEPEVAFCHSCGQRTPQRSTFSGLSFASLSSSSAATTQTTGASSDNSSTSSSINTTPSSSRTSSWKKRPADYQRSDSGYSSFTYSTRLSYDDSEDSSSNNYNDYSSRGTLGSGRGGSGSHYYFGSPPESPTAGETGGGVGADAHSTLLSGSKSTTMPGISIIAPPKRQATYSSSVYSSYDDDDDDENRDRNYSSNRTEAFPTLPVMVEDDYDHGDHHANDDTMFNNNQTPPSRPNNYSGAFHQPGKSRYARLNDLPVLSPRASVFNFGDDDNYDYSYDHYNNNGSQDDDGESRSSDGEKRDKSGNRRRRNFSKSLSVSIMPSQLRRLSLGRKEE